MKSAPKSASKQADLSSLSHADLVALVGGLQQQLTDQHSILEQRDQYILILEELLHLRKIQQFAARSEKTGHQIQLFDEPELEAQIEVLRDELPDGHKEKQRSQNEGRRRQRGFSEQLVRERVELCLSEAEKAGATKTFFTKVKEELNYLPAQLKVIEYWQEKAVFTDERTGEDQIRAALRPVHPLGKCQASTALIAQVITAKYVDGLPLHRQEQIFKRLGHAISRTNMANWIIQLEPMFRPLIHLMREVQNSSTYLQADETRIQVLKEDGKTAQSDKWIWVTRGGPPNQPSVLFEYDPSRAGRVPVRLLDEFTGILQADGYAGYGQVCRENNITRIGCWDHARRKFVEASRAAPAVIKKRKGKSHGKGSGTSKLSKADIALSHINALYRIERELKERTDQARYEARQALSVPRLKAFKDWLDNNLAQVMKGSLTRKAMEYTLNQWDSLVGYCDRGDLNISNALAENAIRPFALGRRAWLFADTTRGAKASAVCYSLIESAKANRLDPAQYIQTVLDRIAGATTLESLEALLPWNIELEPNSKKVAQYP